MDKERSNFPGDEIPSIRRKLIKKIKTEPNEVWTFLKENPEANVVLSSVRRELEDQREQNENIEEFMSQFEARVDGLFDLSEKVEEYGLPLTVELLNEVWRKKQQEPKLTSINEILLKNLEYFNERYNLTTQTKPHLTKKMIQYGKSRIEDYEDYSRLQALKHWEYIIDPLEEHLKEIFDINLISKDAKEIPKEWKAWFDLVTSDIEGIEFYRNEIARLIMLILKDEFEQMNEEIKYKIAPYVYAFEKLLEDYDRRKEIEEDFR